MYDTIWWSEDSCCVSQELAVAHLYVADILYWGILPKQVLHPDLFCLLGTDLARDMIECFCRGSAILCNKISQITLKYGKFYQAQRLSMQIVVFLDVNMISDQIIQPLIHLELEIKNYSGVCWYITDIKKQKQCTAYYFIIIELILILLDHFNGKFHDVWWSWLCENKQKFAIYVKITAP